MPKRRGRESLNAPTAASMPAPDSSPALSEVTLVSPSPAITSLDDQETTGAFRQPHRSPASSHWRPRAATPDESLCDAGRGAGSAGVRPTARGRSVLTSRAGNGRPLHVVE